MASIVIRNLEEQLKGRLRVRAAVNGRSMEAEVREILRSALGQAWPVNGAGAVRTAVMRPVHVEVAEVESGANREPPEFD